MKTVRNIFQDLLYKTPCGEEYDKKIVDQAISELKELLRVTPEQLHKWYLEAITNLSGESYNHNADRPYEMLTEEQKFIDKYIADKVNQAIEEIFT